jgi:hypothetical protein
MEYRQGYTRWIMSKYKDIIEIIGSPDILLILSDEEYNATDRDPMLIVDVRPGKNILLVRSWIASNLTEIYLKELSKNFLPEPKEIYIFELQEANLTNGYHTNIFNSDFGQIDLGVVEQLLYRCRELTTDTLINLVNPDINLKNSHIVFKDLFEWYRNKRPGINPRDTFDNFYSFPFGVLYKTKFRILCLKEENSIMNYQASLSKHFICMNATPTLERIRLVNYLHKEKIVDTCHLSWLNVDNNGNSIRHELDDESCFDYNKRIVLDFEPKEFRSFKNVESVPTFHYLTDSLIDIGMESISMPSFNNSGIRWITEKTWKSYLFGKIGFQFNYPEYYSDLKTFGFELYDEIFDYSFDKIEDNEIRFKEYCKELKRISEIPIKELISQILAIEKKILNNRNHIWDYEFSVPVILKEYPNFMWSQ